MEPFLVSVWDNWASVWTLFLVVWKVFEQWKCENLPSFCKPIAMQFFLRGGMWSTERLITSLWCLIACSSQINSSHWTHAWKKRITDTSHDRITLGSFEIASQNSHTRRMLKLSCQIAVFVPVIDSNNNLIFLMTEVIAFICTVKEMKHRLHKKGFLRPVFTNCIVQVVPRWKSGAHTDNVGLSNQTRVVAWHVLQMTLWIDTANPKLAHLCQHVTKLQKATSWRWHHWVAFSLNTKQQAELVGMTIFHSLTTAGTQNWVCIHATKRQPTWTNTISLDQKRKHWKNAWLQPSNPTGNVGFSVFRQSKKRCFHSLCLVFFFFLPHSPYWSMFW